MFIWKAQLLESNISGRRIRQEVHDWDRGALVENIPRDLKGP